MELYELVTHLRKLINNTRKQGALLQNNSKWNMLCASLDAIEDARSAIRAYREAPATSDTGLKYLQLYGLLQAMVLQQDAAKHISVSLDIPFELHPKLHEIREIRNDSIGHPTRRDRRKGEPECYCLIVQMSLCKDGFQYHRHTPTASGTSFNIHSVNLKDVISAQETLIYEVIEKVCAILEEEENKHRMKYENTKLSDLFPPTTGYYFEKIHDAIHRPEFFGFGKMHVDLISEIVEKFKAALEERGLWGNSDSVNYHYDNIVYPIEQALVFFEDRNSSKLNGKDVEIFISYIRKELDTLKTIADEIDEEYLTPIARPEPKDETERFIGYFQEQLRWIDTIHSRLNQKILLSCLLDTISNARFPDSQNKKRITEFLVDCCNWSDAKRASVPQLLLVLERKNQRKGKLFTHLKGIMGSWVKGDILRPVNDPTLDSLMEIAVEGEKGFVEEKSYQNLFYTYRNHLVHNFREPGYGIEMSKDGDSPYYHSMSKSTNADEFNWQLVFPVEFFQRLCREGLIGLEKYLRENNVNPYDLYPFGEEWSKV